MTQPPGYGPPPTVIVNQKRGWGCGTWFLVLVGIAALIGMIAVIIFIVGLQVA